MLNNLDFNVQGSAGITRNRRQR